MRKPLIGIIVSVVFLGALRLFAQGPVPLPLLTLPAGPPVDPGLRFEAASVKPGGGPGRFLVQGGRLDMSGMPVRALLRQAFRMADDQVVGVPGWADTESYTVLAKPPDGAPANAMPVLITNLLKDRFKLASHVETRQQPVFNLVLARSDGKLGSRLKASSAACQATLTAHATQPERTGPPALPGEPGGPIPFDPKAPTCGSGRNGPGIIGAGGQPIARLAAQLSQALRRPVVDKTGLIGPYDFVLMYTPEAGLAGASPTGTPFIAPDADPGAPNIFTALQEQLGLKLEGARGPVDVVVIDRIERPTLD